MTFDLDRVTHLSFRLPRSLWLCRRHEYGPLNVAGHPCQKCGHSRWAGSIKIRKA